ncbi:glutathione ABC transporter substrate-binding protein [Roseomonas hellenica]|uniref:Glutathione ABC transporter substrate-binding protein n=1 Tax=Plastoroseomonas hellenica TaxID=2687306 RepID=A0ABS5F6I8_9PROT|nr:ABC transporter substrate-binding protein [Plastoroseomonas hellenica]MBR0668162.1 glutathione ABC transporter substrate-binding protein [Plastoroseomonas hellenica]
MTLAFKRRSLLAATFAAATLPAGAAQAASDTLTFIEGSDFDTLDPAISRTRSAEILMTLMFQRLVRWKDTSLSGIEGDLAASWSTSADGLRWTFRLKPGVRFHDGSAVDAEAVKFNFDRLRDPRLGSPNRSLFTVITDIQVADAETITLTSGAPVAGMLEILCESSASISSPAAVQRFGRNYGRNPVGSGPYKFEEWTPGERSVLAGASPSARFRRIIYRPVPEAEARVIELESGNADIATSIPPEATARVRANPRLKLVVIPSSFQVFFELNHKRPPFDNPRLCRAINHAIDQQAIVDRILGGFGSVPDAPVAPGVQSYQAQAPYRFDPDFAKREFAAAFPGGFNETLVMWTCSGRYLKDQQVAEAVQGYLNAIGLKTEFRVWEWASYQQTLYRRQQGGTGFGSSAAHMWVLGTSIPTADWRLSRRLVTGQSANLGGYSNPRIDALLNGARTELDPDRRMEAYHEANRILWAEEPPNLFLYNQKQIIATQRGIDNFDAFAFEVPLLNEVTKA